MNTKPLDKVTKAYKGEMGEDFRKKTRDRINWIVNHAAGKKILDIGCSQGIVPIILGREGKRVEAIDIAQESIDYALEDLKSEHSTVQDNVSFRVSNFMNDDTLGNDYDTVLLTEVLEHLSDPYSCLEKIHSHLTEGGRLIVTVPFGINDYFDHKRTYYYTELMDHLSACFDVEKIEYLGNWVGTVCKKKNEADYTKISSYSRESIECLEKAFYTVERGFVTKIEDFQRIVRDKNLHIQTLQTAHQNEVKTEKETNHTLMRQTAELNEKVNALLAEVAEEKRKKTLLSEENQALQQQLDSRSKELEAQIALTEEAGKKNQSLSEENQSLLKQIEEKERLIQDMDKQTNTLKAEFLNSLNKEEEALNHYLKELEKNAAKDTEILGLERKIHLLEKKYSSLKNSKLGKMTLKYWQARRKLSNKG